MRGVAARAGSGAAVAFVLVACGARSQIAGGGDSFSMDASNGVTGYDGAAQGDGSPFGSEGGAGSPIGKDVGGDAGAACVPSSVITGCAGPNPGDCDTYGCKFDVEWTCGDAHFRSGGACTPPDAPDAGQVAGTYWGVCDVNGKQTSTFTIHTMTCDCKDKQSLATLVQDLCAHQ